MAAMARVVEVVATKPAPAPAPAPAPEAAAAKPGDAKAEAAEAEEEDESKEEEEEEGHGGRKRRKPPAATTTAGAEEKGKEEPAPGPAWVRLRPETPTPTATVPAAETPAPASGSGSARTAAAPSLSPTKRPSSSTSAAAAAGAAEPAPALVALPALVSALAERAITLHGADVAAATATEGEPRSDEDCRSFFLTVGDLLELLSALAAAFPQAALMLQRTVSNRAGAFATQFLLRAVVPAPRHTPPLSIHPATGAPQTSPSTRAHLRVVRAAQTGARLLVVLCVRSAEARRRIVAALAAALTAPGPGLEGERLLWALQAWGELTLALLDPRSNPSRPPPHDAAHANGGAAQQALAWEVVRLMLLLPSPPEQAEQQEQGPGQSPQGTMTEALTDAVRRVPLGEARAATALSALLRPLEILTRCVFVVDGCGW